MAKNYITPEGFKKLQDEFKQLFHDERPKLVETIAWAASNGDRSENADYIYGKRRLRQIDSRLHFLTRRIEAAEVIDPKTLDSDTVVFGATVIVEDEQGANKAYKIVGEDESDVKNGKISWKSPIGKALLRKTAGDKTIVQKPGGESSLFVIEIKFI